MPRRGSRVRSPSRALLDNKKDFRMGSPFLLFEKCGALLETQLLGSLGSISRRAKALLGRARTKVHWTLWHPSRALVIKKEYPSGYPFLLPSSAMLFSIPCCFTARVRFLGALKRPSVVPEPRSTGPCGTRLALLLLKRISVWISFFYYREVRCTSLTHAVLQQGLDFSEC